MYPACCTNFQLAAFRIAADQSFDTTRAAKIGSNRMSGLTGKDERGGSAHVAEERGGGRAGLAEHLVRSDHRFCVCAGAICVKLLYRE
jgi:hypothetical protein